MMYPVAPDFYSNPRRAPIRAGFGRGLVQAAAANERIVGLCADLTESTQMQPFAETYPERFVQVGIAEQNLVTVASGMARMGKVPFAASYAAFSPGRNWEQIRTTICLNDMTVKIIGSHAGVTVGPDGATHQMLEDLALMRVLPNMVVIAPGDEIEAAKATLAIAQDSRPAYLRLSREASPIFSADDAPFEIGKAYVVREGRDITLCGTGIMTAQLLQAAALLEAQHIFAEVVHVPTIKPLDQETILASVRKTGRVLTAEEAQIAGGLGGAIAELLAEQLPTPLKRIGITDRFGESGSAAELLDHFGLTAEKIAPQIASFVGRTPQYHRGF